MIKMCYRMGQNPFKMFTKRRQANFKTCNKNLDFVPNGIYILKFQREDKRFTEYLDFKIE